MSRASIEKKAFQDQVWLIYAAKKSQIFALYDSIP